VLWNIEVDGTLRPNPSKYTLKNKFAIEKKAIRFSFNHLNTTSNKDFEV